MEFNSIGVSATSRKVLSIWKWTTLLGPFR